MGFVTDAHGRPHVAPGLPPLAFNLSHTRGLCACIVGGASAIGVDDEEMRDLDALFEVADHSFASAEVSDLRALGDGAVHDHFHALWTLKESYIKARGLGLSLPTISIFTDSLDSEPSPSPLPLIALERATDAVAAEQRSPATTAT